MAQFLAVANRKGGVGKSTVSVMLAHAFSVWGGKKVLLLDVDSQCNASIILLGGQGWQEARRKQKTIADYIKEMCNGAHAPPSHFLVHGVGDVTDANGKLPSLSLLPGSVVLEDIQGDLFLAEAKNRMSAVTDISENLRLRLEKILRRFDTEFDLVILDCAPGLSFATLSALKAADRIVVPFRPDFVSQLAIDRVALLIEEKRDLDDLADVPFTSRRYACLANFVRTDPREQLVLEEISLMHPVLKAQMPLHDAVASSFDWLERRSTIEDKYGQATPRIREVYAEVNSLFV